jgi:hypothetical protein
MSGRPVHVKPPYRPFSKRTVSDPEYTPMRDLGNVPKSHRQSTLWGRSVGTVTGGAVPMGGYGERFGPISGEVGLDR